MSPISKDWVLVQIRYYFIAPCTFELLGGQMKPGDLLLRSRPLRVCKVCGSPDKGDFNGPDETWKTAVPIEYQNKVVCVECFGKFACEKQVELFRVRRLL
jgi:hypothetical protein